MIKSNELTEIQKKAFISTISDGISEILQGFLFILVALSFIYIYLEFIVAILIFAFLFKRKSIISYFKQKYVFPRIGFVSLRSDYKQRLKIYWILFGIIISLSIISLFIIVYFNSWTVNTTLKYISLIGGGAVLGRSLYFYLFSTNIGYLILGILSLFLAIGSTFIPFAIGNYNIIFYALIQAIIIISIGIFKFHRFIHSNPVISQ